MIPKWRLGQGFPSGDGWIVVGAVRGWWYCVQANDSYLSKTFDTRTPTT